MSAEPTSDWRDLFAPCRPETTNVTVTLYVARHQGVPWLILPSAAALAARGLALYPAQSVKARWARQVLRVALQLGLKPGLEKVQLPLATDDAFVNFLRQTAKLKTKQPLRFAVLAGNPQTEGQRFVLLLFGNDQHPMAVVKAGVSEAAQELLSTEEQFLQSAPKHLPELPELRGTFHERGVCAFALDFFEGQSPAAHAGTELSNLLGAWIAEDRWATLRELGAWQRLIATESERPLPVQVRSLGQTRVHPTIAHGDLTPWNIKSSGGRWTVLDWERGELAGIPGWDWFHFVLQPALLVRRESPEVLLARFEALLSSPEFIRYARRAEIFEHTQALGLAYLAYCLRVTRQTEGRESLQALADLAAVRWLAKPR